MLYGSPPGLAIELLKALFVHPKYPLFSKVADRILGVNLDLLDDLGAATNSLAIKFASYDLDAINCKSLSHERLARAPKCQLGGIF